jgi:hypothetical protein
MWRKTMKREEAKEALRLIAKMLNNPRLKPDDGYRLREAQRELEKIASSGKVDRRKLFRAVRIVCEITLKTL